MPPSLYRVGSGDAQQYTFLRDIKTRLAQTFPREPFDEMPFFIEVSPAGNGHITVRIGEGGGWDPAPYTLVIDHRGKITAFADHTPRMEKRDGGPGSGLGDFYVESGSLEKFIQDKFGPFYTHRTMITVEEAKDLWPKLKAFDTRDAEGNLAADNAISNTDIVARAFETHTTPEKVEEEILAIIGPKHK